MIIGQTEWRRDKKDEKKKGGEKEKRKIWVGGPGSKSPNFLLGGIYQTGAEAVMVFLFS